jgi:hypothetical protein
MNFVIGRAIVCGLFLWLACASAYAQEIPEVPVDTPEASSSETSQSSEPDPEAFESEPLETAGGLSWLQPAVRVGVWSQDRRLANTGPITVGSVQMRMTKRFGQWDGSADAFVQSDGRADLTEAWVRTTRTPVEFTIGRKTVVWGRSDRLNPTDTIGSRDFTKLVANDDEQRRGNFLIKASVELGAQTIDALWLPEFRSNELPVDRSAPGVLILSPQAVSDPDQFAIKLDHTGQFDWSLSWFHGRDRMGDFEIAAILPRARLIQVQRRFGPLDVIGADFAGVAGRIGYRGELAYTKVGGEASPYRKRDNVWAVVGLDTTLDNGWNLNLQYSYRQILDFKDPLKIPNPIIRTVASQSAAVNAQLYRQQSGLTFRAAKNWFQDALAFEISTVGYFETDEAAVLPRLTYPFTDQTRISVGANLFIGPPLSQFGRLRHVSGAFVQLNFGY